MSVIVFNPNAYDLVLSSDPPAWVDNLPPGMDFASPANPTTTCGGAVTTIGAQLALVGGTVPHQVGLTPGSCTVSVSVTSIKPGNLINTIPAGTLIAANPAGDLLGSNPEPASATLKVQSVLAPSLNMFFSPNTLWVGQNSTLTIEIHNNAANTALSALSLSNALPAGLTLAGSPNLTNSCGGSVTLGAASLSLSGGSIAPSTTCTITLAVTSTTPGIYTNLIPANAIQTQQAVTNRSAASAQLNVQAIGLGKSFSPASFQTGGSSTLTILLRNPTASPYTQVSVTDTLPSGLTILTPLDASTTCPSGSLTSGADFIRLSGATIPAGTSSSPGSCRVTVKVTSTTSATYTNRIPAGALSTAQGVTNTSAVTTNVSVYGPGYGLSAGKSFTPDTIAVGGVSRLSISLRAPGDTQLTALSLSDALPAGLTVADPPQPNASSGCGSPVFAPAAGDTLISLSGASLAAGATCTLGVDVTSSSAGSFINTISPANISNTQGRNTGGNFSATLTVSGIEAEKVFYPDSVNPGGKSSLTITLTNTNSEQIDGVSFTDTLPGTVINGLSISNPPNARTTCGGGAVSAAAGSRTISLANGVIPAQVDAVPGICTVIVDVVGSGSANSYTNTLAVGAVRGTIHGSSTVISNPTAATADLEILPLTIELVKKFTPVVVTGGSASTLSIMLSNPNNAELTGIAFEDQLPQRPVEEGAPFGGMSVANPAQLSVGGCGGALSAAPGATSISFSGGHLAANDSCTLTISVTMNVPNNLTNSIGIGQVTTSNAATNLYAADASLTNLAGAGVSKHFSPAAISDAPNATASLVISIHNVSNFTLTGVNLLDSLPAGLSLAEAPAAEQCGGAVSSPTESEIQLTGGSIEAFSNCDITVSVKATGAGSYQNCIPAGALQTAENATNQDAACDTLQVITPPAPPAISKHFSPNPIAAGETAALVFTLTNPNPDTPLTEVAFSDTFPAGLVLASLPNAAQCGGTVTSSAPDSLTLSGGSLAQGGSCSVTVSVTAAAGGSYANTSQAVTSSAGAGGSASDTLTVIDPPAIEKSFEPAEISAGQASLLTFTLSNPNPAAALTGVTFADIFPAGMTVADPPLAGLEGCDFAGAPVFTPAAGAGGLALADLSIAPGGSCTVRVAVTANGGDYTNTSGVVSSANGGSGNSASATLRVSGGGLALEKSTTATSYQAVGDVLHYDYRITNTGNLTLTGTGLGGVFVVNDNKTTVTCPAETTSIDHGQTLTCSATYAVAPGDISARAVTNTATAAANAGGRALVSNPSSVTVRYAALTLEKRTSSTGYRSAGDLLRYTYTLTNTGSIPLYGSGSGGEFMVSDDRIGSPAGTAFACSAAVHSLAPGAVLVCTGTRTYTVTAADLSAGQVTNTAFADSLDRAAGGGSVRSNEDSVTLYRIAPPQISKAFAPDKIPVGGVSTLTITLTNPSTNPVLLSGVGFSDILPAGMTLAAAAEAAQCGGSVTGPAGAVSAAGDSTFTLSGATILANGSCTVSVNVTVSQPGVYANTTTAVTSTNGGAGSVSNTATLTVIAPPVIEKDFAPATIVTGGISTLTFTITNPNAGQALSGVGFNDPLSAGLVIAAQPNAAASGCGSPVFAPSAGADTLSLSSATIAAGETCTLSVNVRATTPNDKPNTTTAVTSAEGGSGSPSNTAVLHVDNAALTLDKSIVSGNPYTTLNGVIRYRYLLTNTGNVTLIGAGTGGAFVITDDRYPAQVTCPAAPAGLAPGDSLACTLDYPVTQADLDAGSITNTAGSQGRYGSTLIPTNQDSVTATATQRPGLSLDKSATAGSPYSAVGTVIQYRYRLTNSGNVTIHGTGDGGSFIVTDDRLSVTCPASPTSLGSGAYLDCSASYTVTQADLNAGSLSNHAEGFAEWGETPLNAGDDLTVNAIQSPALTLTKTLTAATRYDSVGDVLDYAYTLTNSGNVTLSGNGPGGVFTVTDDYIGTPRGTAFACGTATSLEPGESVNCAASYTVSQTDLDADVVTNHANGHGSFGALAINSNTASRTASADQTLSLALVKSITSGSPYTAAGQTIAYSYLVTNTGNVTLTGPGTGGRLTISDNRTGTVTCPATPGGLAPSASVTCTANYTVTQAILDSGSVTNTATANGRHNAIVVLSNTDSETAVATQTPALSLVKAFVSGSPYSALNGSIVYRYTLRNTGNVTLAGGGTGGRFTVTDDQIGVPKNTAFTCGAATSLAPNATVTCTATYTVTQADLDGGSVVNHAAGHGRFGAVVINTAQASLTAAATQTPGLSLDKSATAGSPYGALGTVIQYNYRLTNSGNVTIHGTGSGGAFVVTDDRLSVTCPATPTSLGSGAYLDCSASHTVLQADLDAGSINNHAAAAATWGATTLNAADDLTVNAVQGPALTLSKTISAGSPYAALGVSITYEYELTNSGNVTLSGAFTISDNRIGAPLGTAFACGSLSSLAPGASVTCSADYIVSQSDLDGGSVTNTAAGQAFFGAAAVNSNQDSRTANASQTPGLTLEKSVVSGDGYNAVGQSAAYEYRLTNSGNVTLTGPGAGGAFTVSDDRAGLITCPATPGGLIPGAAVVCSAAYTFTQTDLDAGSVTNRAVGNALFGAQPVTSNEDAETVSADQTISLTLEKSILSGDPYSRLDGQIEYAYLLTNSGNVTLTGPGAGGRFTITDDRIGEPPGTAFECGATAGLAPGASVSCEATYTVTQADLDSGSLTNTATGQALFGAQAVTSNPASQTAIAAQTQALTLVKEITSGSPFTAVGDEIAYSYRLTNSGNVTLTGPGADGRLTISDDQIGDPKNSPFLCPETPGGLAPGAGVTCTAVYRVVQADMDRGSITNTASGHALFGNEPVTSNEGVQTASTTQTAALTLSKSITAGADFSAPGDLITYTYRLTNSGNVTLSGTAPDGFFTLSDDHIGSPLGTPFACGTLTELAPGAAVECSAGYSVTVEDRANEYVTNRATGHATFGETVVDSNQASATTNVKRGAIRGVAFLDKNASGAQDSGESRLSGITIQLYSADGLELLATVVTDANGAYSFPDLLPRPYRVVQTDLSGYLSTTPNMVALTVPPGETVQVDFGDRPVTGGSASAMLSGMVFEDANSNGIQDPGEAPIPGVTVTLYDQEGAPVAQTLTLSTGKYAFSSLQPGFYSVVETNLSGYVSTTLDRVSILLSEGSKGEVNFGDVKGEPFLVDPAVTKTVDPASAKIGDTVTYTISLGNNGSAAAEDVMLSDTLPAFLDLVNVAVWPNRMQPILISGRSFSIDFGVLEASDFYRVTVLARVNQLGTPPGGDNTVTIRTSSGGDRIVNNTSAARLTIYRPADNELPETGFAPSRITPLPAQPENAYDETTAMGIEIPALNLKTTIVGVPLSPAGWDVTWLGGRLGYLAGTAFPTWNGNSVLTGHVYNANGLPGPLINLGRLKWGDQIILTAYGRRYVYEVRTNAVLDPADPAAFDHEERPWLTLVTCKDYDPLSGSYAWRVVVKAVLVEYQ